MTTSSYPVSNPFKVAIVGSGNWGTAVAKLVAENAAENHNSSKKKSQCGFSKKKSMVRN